MQFHLDGFHPGDPDIQPAADRAGEPQDRLPDEVDVLVVGCGPAGLTLAAQLSAFASIRTRIIEKSPGPILRGHADGISVRSMEMFQAFGFAGRVAREAYWVNETTFWRPDPADPGRIVRTGRVQDVEDGLSDMPHVILNQARVHDMYLEFMRNAPRRLAPDYGRTLTDLTVAEAVPDAGDHPVRATIRRDDPGHEGTVETVRAKYVVGCDGARSTVRDLIGRQMTGDFANQAWGVMDVLAVTDFPDIRYKSLIQSAGHGNIVLIPREGGYLARFYIELEKLSPDERVRDRGITVDRLVEKANRILAPYRLDVREVAWWSVYEIGQRLTDRFDDLPDGADRSPRVFIAGDACHTHSPKAGQGMNVSMGDGFNLGWKLAAVLEGRSPPSLLHSYSDERHAVARDLIDFDKEWTQVLSERAQGDAPPRFQEYFVRHGRYTAGTAVRYAPSLLTLGDGHQGLAAGFPAGMRLHSCPVTRLADAKRVELGHLVRADGRWRLFAFADRSEDRMRALCAYLAEDPGSPLRRHGRAGADPDAVLDVRGIFQRGHRELQPGDLPGLLLPRKGRHGLIDYEKAFSAVTANPQDIYDARGIDRARGCIVIVRPDQYVAGVLPLDAPDLLGRYLDGVML